MKVALITGVLGQDGAYLAKLLIEKDYKVYGLVRQRDKHDLWRLAHLDIIGDVILYEADMLSFDEIKACVEQIVPNEIYNLASQSSVGKSYFEPYDTYLFNSISVLNLLETIRLIDKNIKFFQASSNEIYGVQEDLPVVEESKINPVNMYAASKTSAYHVVNNYKTNYDIFASSGILFNHESILRDDSFFIKKVVRESVQVKFNLQSHISLGNLNVKRDFGYAPKYIEAMYLILQQEEADNYIISSGKSILLRDIVEYVFEKLELPLEKLVIDTNLLRKNEIQDIYGSNLKAQKELNWNYNLSFFDVLDEMITFELNQVNNT